MKLRRSRTSRRGRIEIIPMIDVMFFLLATFILTSLSMQRLDAVKVDLPRGAAQALAAPATPVLRVSREGSLQLDRQPVQLGQLAAAVKRLVRPDGNLVIAADAAAAHGLVVQAILQARRGGAEHFIIAVQREH
jgi:biopolymer transport protein ExbD